jgi:DNA-binding CsgD family transcriptional regulator
MLRTSSALHLLGGGGQVGKDLQRTDRMGSPALAEFMAFLTRRPTLDGVCDELVFSWPGHDVIDRACIGRVAHDGSLVMSGCLASRAEVGGQSGAVSIWDETPVAVAVREREVLVLGDRGDIEGRFPEFADGVPGIAAMIVVPLLSHSTPHGVCAVSSGEPLRHPQASAALLSELSLALSLYLLPTAGGPVRPVAWSAPHDDGARSRSTVAPRVLNARQLAVLEGMAEHLTNRQIARNIRFSESTVRQETMSIYAYFGVRGRREAVAAARERGMIALVNGEVESGPSGA